VNPIKVAAKAVLHRAGGIKVFRAIHTRQLRILMYHRFPADRVGLEAQCEHIRRYYQPVTLDDWVRGELPANAIAVTVDDGYRDFLLYGWPVLKSYGIPATVYLVSGFVNQELWLWVDQVRYLVERSGKGSVAEIHERMQTVSNDERLAMMAALPAEFGIELPERVPEEFAPLTWDEVRKLAAEGVTFGAHTHTHPILSRISSRAQLEDEVKGSKIHIEKELGSAVNHFCYPNGTARDISEDAVAAVKNAGFRTAVTTEPGLNGKGEDPLRLSRQGVGPFVEKQYFAEVLAGVRNFR
jgi:peptidoglycan/xylan/chitin deacetylase (PgdA/CDA1 family)